MVNKYYYQKRFRMNHRKGTKIFVEKNKGEKSPGTLIKIFLKNKNKKSFNIIVIEIKIFILFST